MALKIVTNISILSSSNSFMTYAVIPSCGGALPSFATLTAYSTSLRIIKEADKFAVGKTVWPDFSYFFLSMLSVSQSCPPFLQWFQFFTSFFHPALLNCFNFFFYLLWISLCFYLFWFISCFCVVTLDLAFLLSSTRFWDYLLFIYFISDCFISFSYIIIILQDSSMQISCSILLKFSLMCLLYLVVRCSSLITSLIVYVFVIIWFFNISQA